MIVNTRTGFRPNRSDISSVEVAESVAVNSRDYRVVIATVPTIPLIPPMLSALALAVILHSSPVGAQSKAAPN